MKIAVVGTGRSLVAGAYLAGHDNDVVRLDTNASKGSILERGEISIHEPGLDAIVSRNVSARRLRFTTDRDAGTEHRVVQFIAVSTPTAEDGSADLRYVFAGARNIGRYMQEYRLIIDRSTDPVGTATKVRRAIRDELALRGTDIDFSMTSNSEFLNEGGAVEDFMRPDCIAVGVDDERAEQLLREIYAPILRGRDRMIAMAATQMNGPSMLGTLCLRRASPS